MARRAFTLIEVMAVVALIGLLAAATAWSLAGDAQRATRADVLDRLIHADASARLAAQRLGPSTLNIDLDTQQLWVVSPGSGADEPQAGHRLKLPRGHRIEHVFILAAPKPTSNKPPRERVVVDRGVVEIPVSPEGLSRTYAIEWTGPAPEDTNSNARRSGLQTTWLVFAGMTGQVTQHDDEQAIDKLFAALARTRVDAD